MSRFNRGASSRSRNAADVRRPPSPDIPPPPPVPLGPPPTNIFIPPTPESVQRKADITLADFKRKIQPPPSPSISEKRFQREYVYRSCCCELDRRAAKFFSQLFITLMMLSFCFWQIGVGDAQVTGPVWALIGTFVGYWFESPSISGDLSTPVAGESPA